MKQLLYLLQPTALEAVLYLFATIVGLIATSFDTILDTLIADTGTEEVSFDSTSEIFGSNVSTFTDSLGSSGASATVTTLLFWSAAGAVVYIVLWAIFNGFVEFYNEAATTKNTVRGQATNVRSNIAAYFGKFIFRLTAVVLLIAYILIALRLLFPLWIELFQTSIGYLGEFDGWVQLFLAILGGVLSIHIFTILARLISMRLRAYGDFDLRV